VRVEKSPHRGERVGPLKKNRQALKKKHVKGENLGGEGACFLRKRQIINAVWEVTKKKNVSTGEKGWLFRWPPHVS